MQLCRQYILQRGVYDQRRARTGLLCPPARPRDPRCFLGGGAATAPVHKRKALSRHAALREAGKRSTLTLIRSGLLTRKDMESAFVLPNAARERDGQPAGITAGHRRAPRRAGQHSSDPACPRPAAPGREGRTGAARACGSAVRQRPTPAGPGLSPAAPAAAAARRKGPARMTPARVTPARRHVMQAPAARGAAMTSRPRLRAAGAMLAAAPAASAAAPHICLSPSVPRPCAPLKRSWRHPLVPWPLALADPGLSASPKSIPPLLQQR